MHPLSTFRCIIMTTTKDKDLEGNFFVKEFLAQRKAGGGYVDYWFAKLGWEGQKAKRPCSGQCGEKVE